MLLLLSPRPIIDKRFRHLPGRLSPVVAPPTSRVLNVTAIYVDGCSLWPWRFIITVCGHDSHTGQ